MKILLQGGPYDGEIDNVGRHVFRIARIEEVWKESKCGEADRLLRKKTFTYEPTPGCTLREGAYVRHPCKKRGLTRVWRFVPWLSSKWRRSSRGDAAKQARPSGRSPSPGSRRAPSPRCQSRSGLRRTPSR